MPDFGLDLPALQRLLSPPAAAALSNPEPPQALPAVPRPQEVQPHPQEVPLPPPMLRREPMPRPQTVLVPDHEPEVMRALANLARMMPGDPTRFDQDVDWLAVNLDRSTPTDASARFAVDVAGSPADKLAALQARFPKAVPIPGSDNYVYMDPQTGKPRFFNEEGLSFGDVAGFATEAGELGGMMLGGMAGSVLSPIAGTAAGAGLGAGVGRELVQNIGRGLTSGQDTRTEAERARDVAPGMAIGAGSALLGPAIGGVAKAARRSHLLQPGTVRAGANRVEAALRGASGLSDEGVEAAAQLAAREGPAAQAFHLATKAIPATNPSAAMRALRTDVGEDIWTGVSGNVWHQMTSGAAGESAEQLSKNLAKMNPGTREMLFGGTLYDDAARQITEMLPFRTGPGSMAGSLPSAAKKLLAPLIGGAVGMTTGGLGGGAVGAAVGQGIKKTGQWVVSKAMSSGPFLKWADAAIRATAQSPSAAKSFLIRLPAVAADDPLLEDALRILYPEAWTGSGGVQ